MRLLIVVFFASVLTLCSCSNDPCREITNVFLEKCENGFDSCYLTYKDLYPFDWDSLYFFDGMVYPDEIRVRINIENSYPTPTDDAGLLIFVKENQIVKQNLSYCGLFTLLSMNYNGAAVFSNSDSVLLYKNDGAYRFAITRIPVK